MVTPYSRSMLIKRANSTNPDNLGNLASLPTNIIKYTFQNIPNQQFEQIKNLRNFKRFLRDYYPQAAKKIYFTLDPSYNITKELKKIPVKRHRPTVKQYKEWSNQEFKRVGRNYPFTLLKTNAYGIPYELDGNKQYTNLSYLRAFSKYKNKVDSPGQNRMKKTLNNIVKIQSQIRKKQAKKQLEKRKKYKVFHQKINKMSKKELLKLFQFQCENIPFSVNDLRKIAKKALPPTSNSL